MGTRIVEDRFERGEVYLGQERKNHSYVDFEFAKKEFSIWDNLVEVSLMNVQILIFTKQLQTLSPWASFR